MFGDKLLQTQEDSARVNDTNALRRCDQTFSSGFAMDADPGNDPIPFLKNCGRGIA